MVIGGIACLLYAMLVYYVAIKRPTNMIGLVQKKLGKKATERTAVIFCFVFASLALAGAVVLFVLA